MCMVSFGEYSTNFNAEHPELSRKLLLWLDVLPSTARGSAVYTTVVTVIPCSCSTGLLYT